MARKRDHQRTMAQRNQLAYDQGYRGKSGGVSGAYAAARADRATGTPLETDRTARPDLRQILNLGEGRRLVTPRGGQSDKVARSQLSKGQRVYVTATISDGKGGSQQVDLFGKGGWSAAKFRQLVDELGSVEDALADLGGDEGDGNGPAGSSGIGAFVAAQVISYQLDVR